MIEDHGWSGYYNHEAEISLTAAGCKIYQAAITHVVRKQAWEEKPTEFQLKLKSIEHSFLQAA